MTQEDKELLLKDLCARLPYEVKIRIQKLDEEKVIDNEDFTYMWLGIILFDNPYHQIKPYLRPLSSMTKEERQEMEKVIGSNPIEPFGTLTDTCDNLVRSCAYGSYLMLHYLYSHHFDVINLIEKGLALEAPEDMYK